MGWDRQSVLERCAMSAATAWGFYLMARFVNHRWHMAALEQQLQETQAALEHERVKRKADRVGRIRAEQELRAVKVRLQQLDLQQQQRQAGVEGQQGSLQAGRDQDTQIQQDGVPHQQQQELVRQGGAGEEEKMVCAREGVAAVAADGQAQEAQEEEDTDCQSNGDSTGCSGVSAREQQQEAKRAAAAAAAALAAAGSAMPAFPLRPIGHLQSVFSERNGTPRQPQLVPAARSRLVLSPSVPRACLEGLEQYSHCWVLYVFHANTDLAKYLSPDRSGLKAKIHVPRLNGGRMGVLATRSPHRPSPIGLSTAEIVKVEGNTLILGGVDIVDGSPVLDIKPYVPFCDCLPGARAPAWVQAEADDEPLAVGEVVVGEAAKAALVRAWTARRAHSMYRSADEFLELVRQVLKRDIRSVHQRLNVRPTNATGGCASSSSSKGTSIFSSTVKCSSTVGPHAGATFALQTPPPPPPHKSSGADGASSAEAPAGAGASGTAEGQYHVVLENVYISYDISPTGVVELYDAWVDPITARGK